MVISLRTAHVSMVSYKYLATAPMTEQLTKEYFDQTLTTLYKKFDAKIDDQTKELKAFATEQADAGGRIITNAAFTDREFLEAKLAAASQVSCSVAQAILPILVKWFYSKSHDQVEASVF